MSLDFAAAVAAAAAFFFSFFLREFLRFFGFLALLVRCERETGSGCLIRHDVFNLPSRFAFSAALLLAVWSITAPGAGGLVDILRMVLQGAEQSLVRQGILKRRTTMDPPTVGSKRVSWRKKEKKKKGIEGSLRWAKKTYPG